MAKCGRCGAETDLYELDVPICPECCAEREKSRPSLANLSAELALARALYRKAMEEFERHQVLCPDLPQGHPDRTTGARLQEMAKTAGERYWDLLRAYGEALRRDSG